MLLIHGFLNTLSSLCDFFLDGQVQETERLRQMYSELYSLQCMPSLLPIKEQRDNEYSVFKRHRGK